MPADPHMSDRAELEAYPARDRILLLGRRKAGKTVFLARLYEQAWRGQQALHMRALDGSLHETCMDMVDQLKSGRWPAATAGSLSSGVDVSWQGQHATMVLLDYPGEVFRRAFVEGGGDEQSDMLIDHVDHAAAVILLIDPGNVHTGDVPEFVDDDYGMVQAVDRIRRSPGGDEVPIAVALTKCDEHLGIVQDAGGARGFVEKHLPNIVRYGGRMRMFATAAVRTRLDAVGRAVPNTQHEPAGLIDSVNYCLKHVGRQLVAANHRRDQALQAGRRDEAVRLNRQTASKARRRWIAFWVSAAVVALAAVGGSMMVSFGGLKPSTDAAVAPIEAVDLGEESPAEVDEPDVPLPASPPATINEPSPMTLPKSSTAPPLQGGFAEVFRRGHRSTPFIETQCRFGECPLPELGHSTPSYHGHGSGVLIEYNGDLFVVTNRHVIESGDDCRIMVRFFELDDAGSITETLRAIESSPRDFKVHPDEVDLAWINVSQYRGQFAAAAIAPMLLSETPLGPGSDIAFVGHPGRGDVHGFEPLNLTRGAVSSVFDDPDWGWTIGTDATINGGNSGGPGFGLTGRVCGIAVGVRGSSFGMEGGSQNYAVDAREIPEAIAGGVPFDPDTMLASSDPGTLADLCGDLQQWPLTDEEVELLDAVLDEQWELVGCERVDLAAAAHSPVDLASLMGSDRPDQVLVFASPFLNVDIDLHVYDSAGDLIETDVRGLYYAHAKASYSGGPQRGNSVVVRNASRTTTPVLVMVFK